MDDGMTRFLSDARRTVVGVVGKGHVRGVTYVLRHFHNHHLRFRDLAGLGGDEGGVGRWVR